MKETLLRILGQPANPLELAGWAVIMLLLAGIALLTNWRKR